MKYAVIDKQTEETLGVFPCMGETLAWFRSTAKHNGIGKGKKTQKPDVRIVRIFSERG